MSRPLEAPWRITFDTNPDDCNLRCVMCEEHSNLLEKRKFEITGIRRRMDVAMLRRVLAECAPQGLREIIPSTMGEPLLYEDFDDILEACREHGVKLNLTTNGTFPGRGARAWAEAIVPLASDVKISWNGSKPETQAAVMVGTRYENQLRNLKEFLSVRDAARAAGQPACTVTLQLTFMETNLREIPSIVELAIALGIDRVKGHHLWVHLPEMQKERLLRDPEAVRRWNRVASECRELATSRPLPNGALLQLANFDMAGPEASTRDGPCPFLGKEAWVNWEGRFDPCCAPDYLRKSLGTFGNVRDGLLPIWRGERYQHLQETYRDQEVCKTCVMRTP